MRNDSDPTASAAIGAIDREFKAKEKLAKRLRFLRRRGLLTEKELTEAGRQFTGIFAGLYLVIFEEEQEEEA